MDARLKSKRLNLRHVTAEDVDVIQACIHDPRIYEMVARIPANQSRKATLDWIFTHDDGRKSNTDFVYAINSQKKFIGLMGFHRETTSDLFELGFWIAPQAWGNGYATEAGEALLLNLETRQGAKKTLGSYFSDNRASGRVLEKLGYIKTGEGRMHCAGRNKVLPLIKMERAETL